MRKSIKFYIKFDSIITTQQLVQHVKFRNYVKTMRLFRKLVSNLNPKLVNRLKLLRTFNSFSQLKTNHLVIKKLLAKQPLNYYDRLVLTITKNLNSKIVNTNLKWLISFIKSVKTKNRTQTRLINLLMSKPFHKLNSFKVKKRKQTR